MIKVGLAAGTGPPPEVDVPEVPPLLLPEMQEVALGLGKYSLLLLAQVRLTRVPPSASCLLYQGLLPEGLSHPDDPQGPQSLVMKDEFAKDHNID